MTQDEGVTLDLISGKAESETLNLPENTVSPSDSQPQQVTIGRFHVRAKLGEGAFGEVYRAYDPQLDREVALKVAKPAAVSTSEKVARFLREAKASAGLRHPNIVPVYDSGRDGSFLCIASGFIEGRTLRDEIEESNGKPLDRSGNCVPHAPKNELKPWLKQQWVIPPKANAAFVAKMEDVLDIYETPSDSKLPVVCVDVGGKQLKLIGDTCEPLPMRPESPAKQDYEYQRGGMANLFMAFEPLAGRHLAEHGRNGVA